MDEHASAESAQQAQVAMQRRRRSGLATPIGGSQSRERHPMTVELLHSSAAPSRIPATSRRQVEKLQQRIVVADRHIDGEAVQNEEEQHGRRGSRPMIPAVRKASAGKKAGARASCDVSGFQ
jgi:hypothetical protein